MLALPLPKRFAALLLWVACSSTTFLLGGADPPAPARPLDLPAGIGSDEDEEDAPEVISFYGNEFEGDGFFWCLDVSGSMNVGDRLPILKQEVTQAISSLSPAAEFSVVAFSSSTIVWSAVPCRATPVRKMAARTWVLGLTANGWTCLAPAGIQAIAISNLSSKRHKVILIVGDGRPICDGMDTSQECLTDITGANWQRTPINTLYISNDSVGIAFMQQLAAMNDGSFVLVND